MIYCTIIFLLVLLAYHYDYQNHIRYRSEWFIVLMIIFILVAGLRYRLGIDSTRYEYYFTSLPSLGELSTFDYDSVRYGVGYLFLNAIARSLSDNFVIMQCLHAIFINSIIFWFIYRNTRHIFTALLLYAFLYYFTYNFEILRESCAAVIFLYSWQYFKNEIWGKYYICCIIAILFHPSAIFLLILPVFYLPAFRSFFRMGWTFGISCGCVFIIAAYLSVRFFDYLQLITIASVDDYAASYADSTLGGEKSLNIKGIGVFIIKIIIYPLVTMICLKGSKYFRSNIDIPSNITEKLEYLLCWYVYIAIISNFIQIFYRFNNYLTPFWTLALADVLFSVLKVSKRKLRLSFGIWTLLILPYLSLNIYGYFLEDGKSGIKLYKRYYPYSSVLNPVKDEKREQLFRYLGGA